MIDISLLLPFIYFHFFLNTYFLKSALSQIQNDGFLNL